jgi:hypothetical protein
VSNSFDQSESSHFKRDTSLSTMPVFGTESCFCTVCSAQLLSLHAFDTLLQKGLVFAIRRDNLKCLALIKCSMCRFFSSILTSHMPDWLRAFTHLLMLMFRVTAEFVGSGAHKNFPLVFDVAEHFSERFSVASCHGLQTPEALIKQSFADWSIR